MDNHFFDILEFDLNIKIPNYVKNALQLFGFGNALSFADCSEDNVKDLEQFMREEFALMIGKRDKIQMVNYFGEYYYENSSNFKFLQGDKKLIKKLSEYVRRVISIDENGIKHFKKNSVEFNESPIDVTPSKSNQVITRTHKDINLTEAGKKTHYFLNKLILATNQNETREKGGYRYDDDIKSFALYLRLLAGPIAYDTIQRNLECALPSISSTNRYVQQSSCKIIEGIVRSHELLQYLRDRNLPLLVSLSQDETRLVGEVQYDAKTNQVTGFTLPLNETNSLPIPFAYPARNASEIMKHFSLDHPVSLFLNVIMAQPLVDKVPPFCLLAFGSNSNYTSYDVLNRWTYIKEILASLGIKVLTWGTDSDPKLNSAMRYLSKLGTNSDYIKNKYFFSGATDDTPFCIQDPEHIATKWRNFILRTGWNGRRLPLGRNCFIDLNHLYFIMRNYRKDHHELTNSVLNPVDKQNFKSAERMYNERVTKLLRLNENHRATAVYLETIRDIIDSFRDKSLAPLERIRKIWHRVLLLRLWRRYILQSKHYTLENNFITMNCYVCVELNAHSLVQIILYLQRINKPESFLPHLLGSQQCESCFRQLRLFAPTFSVAVNCGTKAALSRLSKIQIQNDIMQSTSSKFKYPRFVSKSKAANVCHSLPTLDQINQEIERCAIIAIQTAEELELVTQNDLNDKNLLSCTLNLYSQQPSRKFVDRSSPTVKIKPLKLSDLDGIALKTFPANKVVDESSPYVELNFKNKLERVVVRKSSLVWLLRRDAHRLSSDRLRRVQCSTQIDYTARTKSRIQSKKTSKKTLAIYPYKKLSRKRM